MADNTYRDDGALVNVWIRFSFLLTYSQKSIYCLTKEMKVLNIEGGLPTNRLKKKKAQAQNRYFKRKENVNTSTSLSWEVILAVWHFRNADSHFLFPVHSGSDWV